MFDCAPFGLEASEVECADGEFAPRQGATLVAIERREGLGGLHPERVGAQDPAAVVCAATRRRRRAWCRLGRLGQHLGHRPFDQPTCGADSTWRACSTSMLRRNCPTVRHGMTTVRPTPIS